MNNDFLTRYPITDLLTAIADKKRVDIQVSEGGCRAAVIADLAYRTERPWFVVLPDRKQVTQLLADLSLFFEKEDLLVLPEFDVGPYHRVQSDRRTEMERLGALYRLAHETPRIVLSSASGSARLTIPKAAFDNRTRVIKPNDEIDDATFRLEMAANGYAEVTTVEDPGTFSVRGDIIDVYSCAAPFPIRIERWGDDVAELRTFNPRSQRTLETVDKLAIVPARSEDFSDDARKILNGKLRQIGEETTIAPRRLKAMMSDISAGLHFVGIDAILPAFYDELVAPESYLPDDTGYLVIEPEIGLERVESLIAQRRAEYDVSISAEDVVFEPNAYYQDAEATRGFWTDKRATYIRTFTVEDDPVVRATLPTSHSFSFRFEQNLDVEAKRKSASTIEQTFDALQSDLASWKDTYGRVCFTCRTEAQAERLERILRFSGHDAIRVEPPFRIDEPVPPPTALIEIYKTDLSSGFRSELLSVAVISDRSLFGARVKTRKSEEAQQDRMEINHFKDLSPGDLVVHIDFGIGRYMGLERHTVGGITADFLHIEYAKDEKLFIPTYRLGRIQKYIGSPDGVRIDRLGGNSWEKKKERVKENIREVASELIELYARREIHKGISFSEPDAYYYDFEAAFPYEETPDQARAIDDTISDMTRDRPMDRLVCGDVGFGKTEVAIRAAMKAVVDGRQVAVLVPTTILCEQHVKNFRERLEQFGVRVEGLSRFRTTKQTKQILADTAAGNVDVIVGTHRLISSEMTFKNLGILIIDEEQRFGVKHKEKLKQFKHNVDVLTLTATPIPRTMQMSLLGIRDLSIIATPPHDRLEVRTHIARFNDTVIRDAIMREISRGGQVFFVHNRVQTIDEMAEYLGELVPDARIAVAHGQMAESDLEDVMVGYINNETHVLLCSSIIESGLDIPNANTIIVNRADRFGLSQLYQLRGRVGRGKERAYAFLLIPARTKITSDAEKRLEVIQTFTELGSGFHVATYDLELRGAGNLLGNNQSGHVAAVGLDLYSELLEEAVTELRGEVYEGKIEPEVTVPVPAYIPDDYIEDASLRLIFYKRFSIANDVDSLEEMLAEMNDRFGPVPDTVQNLKDVVRVKLALLDLRAVRLDIGPALLSITLDRTTPIRPDRVVQWVSETQGRAKLTPDMRIVLRLTPTESEAPFQTCLDTIARLKSMC